MFPQNYPTLQDMARNLALNPNAIEVIWQPLYDFNIYPTAGATSFSFFQQPIGAGQSSSSGVAAGVAKFLTDTNMEAQGQLPAPMAFWAAGFELSVDPGSVATANTYVIQPPSNFAVAAAATVQAGAHDVNAILSTGALKFTISQKPYYQEGPLYRFPSRTFLRYDGAVASNSATVGETVKEKLYAAGDLNTLSPGFGIMTSQNFKVELIFPVAIATPSGFNARVGVYINGWQFRAA